MSERVSARVRACGRAPCLLGAAQAVLDELLDAVTLADDPAHLEVPHLLAPRLLGVGLGLELGVGLVLGVGLGGGLGLRFG